MFEALVHCSATIHYMLLLMKNKLEKQYFNHGPSHLEKQEIWKDIFQKSCQLLAANVMCLSKAFYLITEIQKSKEALGALPSPLLSQGAHYLS